MHLPATQSLPKSWTYAELMVLDGGRKLKPSHVAFDRLVFNEPPQLTGSEIEIILTNGESVQRHVAAVLPHDPGATRIPIRLRNVQGQSISVSALHSCHA